MLSDTWTDLTAGLSVGTTKESRKLDAMIAYIKTGKGYSAAGDSHVYADLLGNRASALEQVLASPSASSVQKEKAAAAFSGVIKREGIEFHGREVRSLCSKLGDLETGVSDQDKALLSSIKHELGQQILKGSTKGLNAKLDTAEERLAYLNGYKNESGGAQIAEGINEQIEILESAIEEQKRREMLLETAISSLGNKSFNEKLSAINDKIAAYTQATGGKPQAGEKHDKSGSGIEARYNALNQVLKSSHATPTQKADALKAFYTELGSAAAIDASFHIDVFRGLFVRGVGDDQGNHACKGLLAALNQDPSVFSLANLKAIESSLNTSGGLSGDKVISLQNRVKELISQKVTEENLKHIGNIDLSSGKRVSAFLDILKDEGVSPENKDKAFDALLEALEKDGFHPGLENLENIRSSLFNENGEKASLLRGKVQVAVDLDSIDKSKSVDENIGFCLDVCKSVNASPKQKSEACEKLASILKDIQEERFTDDQLSHIDRILGARGVDSKSLSDERGLISARRDLYVLRTGMLPGTSGLGGSAHASIEDRLNAFFFLS